MELRRWSVGTCNDYGKWASQAHLDSVNKANMRMQESQLFHHTGERAAGPVREVAERGATLALVFCVRR